jgi:5-formyltetrahydrofolate cyclo-ligase
VKQTSRSRLPRASIDATDRAAARRALRVVRAGVGAEGRAAADARIAAAVEKLVAGIGPSCVAGYWPMDAEPDLRPSMARWHAAGIVVALPRVAERHAPLVFERWVPGCELVAGPHGTSHVARADRVEPRILVIPCLGFDPRRHRLGYGGGYYDRTLAAVAAASIGVAYDVLEVLGFEAQAHDRRLDWIVTESRVLAGAAARY